MSRMTWSSSTSRTRSSTIPRVAAPNDAVELRGVPENIQKTLNRRSREHLERNVALPPRLHDGLEHTQQGRVCELQVSEVQANVGKATVEQRLERLDQVRVVGEVELPLALQDHAIS